MKSARMGSLQWGWLHGWRSSIDRTRSAASWSKILPQCSMGLSIPTSRIYRYMEYGPSQLAYAEISALTGTIKLIVFRISK